CLYDGCRPFATKRQGKTREETRCPKLTSRCYARVSDKLNESTTGGSSPCLCLSDCRHSSFIPPGQRYKGSTTGSDHISRLFIRRNCSAPPIKAGLVQCQAGCRCGLRRRSSSSGRRAASE